MGVRGEPVTRRRPYRGHGAKTIRPQLRVSLPHLEAKAKEKPKTL
jgi:hypothetical protein